MITEWDGIKLADMTNEQLIGVCRELAVLLAKALSDSEALQAQFSELSKLTAAPVKKRILHA